MAILWQKAECAEWMFLQCRLCTHCVGCQQRSFLQHSCSNIAGPANSLETMCRMCSQARLAMQALCRLSPAVLTTAAQAQRRPRVEWAFMLCRLNASTAAAVTSSPFYSNSCSEIAGLPCELKIETMCRASVHAMQAVQTLSHLGSPLYNNLCPELACTASAFPSIPFYSNSFSEICLPCELKSRPWAGLGGSCNAGRAGTVSAVNCSRFHSSSCSNLPVLRTLMETLCRLGVHAFQTMQALHWNSLAVLSTADQARRSPALRTQRKTMCQVSAMQCRLCKRGVDGH